MNNLTDIINLNSKCTLCGLCWHCCPQKCISFEKQSFQIMPKINESKCINCGLCKLNCEKQSDCNEGESYIKYIYYKNNSNLLSSSGGFAFDLIEKFLSTMGVVYCVVDRSGEIGYERLDNTSDLKFVSGSKYLKASFLACYKEVEEDIKNKKKILFVGIPCDMEAIKKSFGFYKEGYFCCLACGGAIPNEHFTQFKTFLTKKYNHKIIGFNFRSKKYLPVKYCLEITLDNGKKKYVNKEFYYYMSLMNSPFMRQSCLNCNIIEKNSFNFLIGDNHKIDDGSTLITTNNRGLLLLKELNLNFNNYSPYVNIDYFVYKRHSKTISSNSEKTKFCFECSINIIKAIKKYIVKKEPLKRRLFYVCPYKLKRFILKIKK